MQPKGLAYYSFKRQIEEAILVLRNGGVIAFPTESFYGLGADPFNEAAVKRIFEIKAREGTKPILLLIGSREKVVELTEEVTPQAAFLMERFWPGPLTLVLKASKGISPLIHCGTKKVGLRLSPHPVALSLARSLGAITGTSCNLSGQKGLITAQEVKAQMGNKVDLILDWEIPCAGIPSTVLDVSENRLKVLREGQISREELTQALKKKFDIPPQI